MKMNNFKYKISSCASKFSLALQAAVEDPLTIPAREWRVKSIELCTAAAAAARWDD